ncbi:cyclophilin type peptidyl-prolyl cis-trans isomerase [Rhodococcus opacus M213]|uniref:Peptidyl-prolyl cis-trans isomerase n=1 Tax=Rhodococcus opacus M213 TaxID=1129896 RepID=K8XKT9_RHOOP|nr:peptidylprolyl isomerase [Rhodococcus opacus]EKT81441.1 cyclophilin type peptidyl-prolyl cis-trans isomerase [Rhodococcus opacus M213]
MRITHPRWLGAIAVLVSLFLLPAPSVAAAPQPMPPAAPNPRIVMVTEVGPIVYELYPDKAPKSVEQFLRYVDTGYVNGGSFFRSARQDNQPGNAVKIDVIQGDVHPWTAKVPPIPPVELETTNQTGLTHSAGTLSFARTGTNPANSSFFITTEDEPELDFGGERHPDGQGFAAFGRVVQGMEIVHLIHALPTQGQSIIVPPRILSAARI